MIQIVCDCVVEVESRTEKSAKYKFENPGNVCILSGVVNLSEAGSLSASAAAVNFHYN